MAPMATAFKKSFSEMELSYDTKVAKIFIQRALQTPFPPIPILCRTL